MLKSALITSAVILLTGYYVSGLRTKLACEYETMTIDCLEDQGISIKSVEFGRKNGIYCNTNNMWTSRVTNCSTIAKSVNTVSTKCQHKKSCSISAESYTLGDPCAFVQKYLEVGYECENMNLNTQFACESETLTISCSTGKKITVNEATFGRTNPVRCLGPTQIVNTNLCRSANSTAILTARCDGKQTCTTPVSANLFGDPCSRIPKFLEVKYVCN